MNLPLAPNRALRSVASWLRCALVAGFAMCAGRAAEPQRLPAPGELEAIFKPFRTDLATLAPDGRHLAYAAREGTMLFVMIADVDRPDVKATLMVGEDVVAGFFDRRVLLSARITFLQWLSAQRLVYGLNAPSADRTQTRDEVRVVDADGKNDRKLVDSHDLEEVWSPPGFGENAPPVQFIPRRPRVLGLCPDDPEAILVEAIGGRAIRSEVFKVSLAGGKPVSFFIGEEPGRYLYDRQGRPRILETPTMQAPLLTGMGGRGGGGMGRGMRGMGNTPMLVPQVFRYRAADTKRWQDLDDFLGKGAGLVFRNTAETYYGHRSFPLGFGADPDVLYFASNVGRDTYGLYALDLRTKQRTDFAVEVPGFDCADPGDALSGGSLIFDRRGKLSGVRLSGAHAGTRWFEGPLARLQEKLDADFTGRHVEILDWDDTRTRLLLIVTGAADPGRYFIYQNSEPGRLTEFLRRAPWLNANTLNPSVEFVFDTPAGVHLTGMLTLPRHSRITPPPLVLVCRELPGRRERPGFSRDIEALADMGFFVAQVNYRGAAGFGAQHRDAAKAGLDRVPVDDLRAAVAWIAAHYRINAKRVGLLGTGFGGFVALRAVQLFPAEFRCAISFNAPTDPAHWLNEPRLSARGMAVPTFDLEVRREFFDQPKLAELAVAKHLGATQRPVFIIQDPEQRNLWPSQGTSLRDALKRHGLDVEYLETTGEFARGELDARAKVFAKIAEFLNDHIYDFNVDVGEAKEVR